MKAMTEICFEKYRETFIFSCRGHTEYASAGRDILCSAVSALCYTLAAYLEKKYCSGDIENYRSDMESGSVTLTYELSDCADESAVTEAVTAILAGFSLLAESFPDYIYADL
ncbi:MAG: ribosomal-processing cysteine protease Prp [Clostridia bacterium]|nr:ribosomal-processing cysteine protease Prp [Clostridia bacterium]